MGQVSAAHESQFGERGRLGMARQDARNGRRPRVAGNGVSALASRDLRKRRQRHARRLPVVQSGRLWSGRGHARNHAGAEGGSVHSRVPNVGTKNGAPRVPASLSAGQGDLPGSQSPGSLPAPRARFQSAQTRASAPRCRPPPSRSVGPASDPMRELAERASAWTCRRLAKSVRTRRFNWPLHATDPGG